MKKILSVIMAMAVILSMSAVPAFADDSDIMLISANPASGDADAVTSATEEVLSDVSGADCEEAAYALVNAGIITGYEDGTFRPDGTITRAEVCAMIYRAYAHTDMAYLQTGFSDVDINDWCGQYVAYCADTGIIKGDGDGTFRPDGNVTYNELLTMYVRLSGLADDATMVWPDDYVSTAIGAGLVDGISIYVKGNGDAAVTRGKAAIITYNAVKEEINGSAEKETTTGSAVETTTGSAVETTGSAIDNSGIRPGDSTDNTGELYEFAGKAYGFILSTGKAIDSKGNTVDMCEFKVLDETYTLYGKNDSVDICSYGPSDGLVQLTVNKGGIVTKVTPMFSLTSGDIKSISPQNTSGKFEMYKVSRSGSTYIEINTTGSAVEYIGANNPLTVYQLEPSSDGYKISLYTSPTVVAENDYAAAFVVDKESYGVADIIVFVDSSDVDSLLFDDTKGYKALS